MSPVLGIRFVVTPETMELYRPDGRRFETFAELSQRAEAERQRAEAERQRAEAERQARERALAEMAQERQVNAALRAELERLQRQLAEGRVPPPLPEPLPEA